jgi:hypothetical protein
MHRVYQDLAFVSISCEPASCDGTFYRMKGALGSKSWLMPQRKTICSGLAAVVMLGFSTFDAFGQTLVASIATPPQHSAGPITDYGAALPNLGDVLRFRRGERYNIPNPSLSELGEDSEPGIWELPLSHFGKDAMPFAASDVVVVGTVTAGQSFLSNDRRDIYSEFKFKLEEVVKNSANFYVRMTDSIIVQRKGGAVRLPSGKVLTRGVVADSMPQIGSRYLLFLKYDQSTQDYSVLMGYSLNGNDVYRLDALNPQDASFPQVVHPLHSEGVSETEFLARAKSTLLSQDTRSK